MTATCPACGHQQGPTHAAYTHCPTNQSTPTRVTVPPHTTSTTPTLQPRIDTARAYLDTMTTEPMERKRPPSLKRDSPEWDEFAAQYLSMDMPADLPKAAIIAVLVHKHQTDQLGEDYIAHPARIADSMLRDPTYQQLTPEQREHAVQAAWLHDTIEDTALTLDDLRDAGFHPEVIESVDLVTSRKNEPKDVYYARIAEQNPDGTYKHPVARFLKGKDLDDNNQEWRRESLPGSPSNPVDPADVGNPEVDRFTKLGKKYAKAYPALGFEAPPHLAQFAE